MMMQRSSLVTLAVKVILGGNGLISVEDGGDELSLKIQPNSNKEQVEHLY